MRSIGSVTKDIPQLADKLATLLHLRVEHLVTNKDKTYTLRNHHWIKPDNLD